MRLRKIVLFVLMALLAIIAQAQEIKNADDALKRLKAGNERFVNGSQEFNYLDASRRTATAEHGQHPYATILGCSDSRVPIEPVFDAGIGELFIIRVAGNVINIDEAGSIEYGVEHLHTPVMVVLGHTQCGAVTAVVKDAEVHGNIPALVSGIKTPVQKAKEKHGHEFSETLLSESIKLNVYQSIEDLFRKSHVTAKLVKEKKLKVIAAIYHLDTGEVEWLGEHPNQNKLIHH